MSAGTAGLLADALMWVSLLVAAGCVSGSVRGLWRARLLRLRMRMLLGHRGEDAAGSGRSGSSGRSGRRTRRTGKVLSEERRKRRARWMARGRLPETAAAIGSGALAVTVVAGAAGWLVGCAAAYGVWRWTRGRAGRGQKAQEESEARAVAQQLPLTAELMAACLAAGSSPAPAAEAVGRSLGGPVGTRLIWAATELRLGAEPAAVWGRFGPLWQEFGRCMERAGTAGVPAVEPVARFAAELRARQARAASARARRAAVLVTGPLGLCFLPAFLAVGVAPVVMGLARSLL